MATWTKTFNQATATDANLAGPLTIATGGTAPGDFDPAAVNSVRFLFTVGYSSGTFNDDTWTVHGAASFGYSSGGYQELASVDGADNTINDATDDFAYDITDSTGIPTGASTANWEAAQVTHTVALGNFATWNKSKGADGVTVRIHSVSVIIDYTPATTDRQGQVFWAELEVPNAPPQSLPLTDNFTGTNGDPWDSAKWIGVTADNASKDIQGNEGRLVIDASTAGANVTTYANIATTDDIELLVKVDNKTSVIRGRLALGLRTSTTQHTDGDEKPATGYYIDRDTDGSTVELQKVFASGTPVSLGSSTLGSATEVSWFRFRLFGDNIKAKHWANGSGEPAAWTWELRDSAISTGVAWVGFAREGGAPDIYLDDYQLSAVTPPVWLRGSTGGLQTSASGTSINLSKPTGTVEGDTMLVGITTSNILYAPQLSGWTLATTSRQAGGTGATFWLKRIAGASEPGSYTFTLSTGTSAMSGAILSIKNTHLLDVAVSEVESTHPHSLALTGIDSNAVGLIGFLGQVTTNTADYTYSTSNMDSIEEWYEGTHNTYINAFVETISGLTSSTETWENLLADTDPALALFSVKPSVSDRQGQVTWAEMEVPDAPRQAQVTWAELETPDGARQAQVTWTELEIPTAPRTAIVTWAEAEIPTAPRTALVTWAELETPDAPRQAQVTWAELETPDGARQAQVTWAELETGDAARQAQVTWAEFEVPTNNRRAWVTWSEIEIPDGARSGVVSWAEMETTDPPRQGQVTWAELEVPDGPRQAQVTWAEIEIGDGARQAQVTWSEMELPDAPRQAQVTWAEMEIADAGSRTARATWAEMEVPTAPRQAQVTWSELETPDGARQAQVTWAELEVGDGPRTARVTWAEIETGNAARRAVVSWSELEVPEADRTAQVTWGELEVPTAPRTSQVTWAEMEVNDAPRQAQVTWAEFEVPAFNRMAIVTWAQLEIPDGPSGPPGPPINSWFKMDIGR